MADNSAFIGNLSLEANSNALLAFNWRQQGKT